jgi:hypothetical protein
VVKLEPEFRKSDGLVHAGHEWKERTAAIQAQRAHEQRTELTGKRRLVRMRTPPFEVSHSSFHEQGTA